MRLSPIRRAALGTTTAVVATLALAASAAAQPIVGLTKSDQLFMFDSATPSTLTQSAQTVSGLAAGDHLIAIDRSPINGQLYGISQNRFYRIDAGPTAVQVGPNFPTPLASADADIDLTNMNSARIVTATGQNIGLNVLSGDETVQSPLEWAQNDPNEAKVKTVEAIAYDHNYGGGGTQTAFVYQFTNDIFASLAGASGVLTTIGLSGVSTTNHVVGLDIAPNGTAFAALRTNAISRLYTMNTATGAATLVGPIGNGGDTVRDIATDAVTNEYRFSTTSFSGGESDRKLTVTVKRGTTIGSGFVNVQSANGSATAGQDYEVLNGAASFADGSDTATLEIPLRSDATDEVDETFTVVLSNPGYGHASLGVPSTTTATISDDDDGPVPAESVTLLSSTNSIATLDSRTPANVSAPIALTGLPGGEELLAIDRRPATGVLYALGKTSRLYAINETTGAATAAGNAPFTPALNTNLYGFDFDPVSDRVRISTANGTGANTLVNPDDGTAVAQTPFAFAPGDAFAGVPRLVATAYANNVPGATSSTLYGYEYSNNQLVRIGAVGDAASAATGTTTSLGSSGVQATTASSAGLDIAPDGTAWALLDEQGGEWLDYVDLDTPDAARVGLVGNGAMSFRDLALGGVSNTIQLSKASFAGGETARSVTVTVVRNQTRGAASVRYATVDGSAFAGADYPDTSGTVTFADGQASADIAVPVTDDSEVEPPEALTVTLSDPRGGTASLGATSTSTLIIADNDSLAGQQGAPSAPPAGPPGPPASGPPASDPKAVVKLCGTTKQDIVKQKYVTVCLTSNEVATADLTGKLAVKGVKKPFALTALKAKKLAANKQAKLKVKLPKKALKALKKSKKGSATITIAVRDGAGNVTSASRKVSAKAAKKKKRK